MGFPGGRSAGSTGSSSSGRVTARRVQTTLKLRDVPLIDLVPASLLVVIATVALLPLARDGDLLWRCNMKLASAGRRREPDQQHRAPLYDLLTEGFGPGFNGPLTAVGVRAGRAA